MVCLFCYFIKAVFQEKPLLFQMSTIPFGVHMNRFAPDEDPFWKRIGENESVPGRKSFNIPTIRCNHHILSILKGLDHILEGGEPFTCGWTHDRMVAKQFPCLAHDLTIPMRGDEETHVLPSISPVHHEKPCVPEGHNKWDSSFPQRSWDFRIDYFNMHGSSQDPDRPIGDPGSHPSHNSLS